MSTESHRALRFRCAKTGKRFIVVFYRASPAMRYVVVNVVDESEFSQKKPKPKKSNRVGGQIESPTASPRKLLPAAISGAISAVQRYLSRPDRGQAIEKSPPKQASTTPEPKQREQYKPPPSNGQPGDSFNIDEFNFTGWYCPCCGHGKQKEQHIQFLRCGKCGEYVCGSRIVTLPSGQQEFTCYDRCGNRGILGGGAISSMRGMGLDEKKPALINDLASRHLKSGQSQRKLKSGKDKD